MALEALFKVYKHKNPGVEVLNAAVTGGGEREMISTAFVESTVNQVVSKRMVKKQQMRWSQGGAHLLLQVRTQEQNGELQSTFGRWYPGLVHETEPREPAA